jgi:hypothetical protein
LTIYIYLYLYAICNGGLIYNDGEAEAEESDKGYTYLVYSYPCMYICMHKYTSEKPEEDDDDDEEKPEESGKGYA